MVSRVFNRTSGHFPAEALGKHPAIPVAVKQIFFNKMWGQFPAAFSGHNFLNQTQPPKHCHKNFSLPTFSLAIPGQASVNFLQFLILLLNLNSKPYKLVFRVISLNLSPSVNENVGS